MKKIKEGWKRTSKQRKRDENNMMKDEEDEGKEGEKNKRKY
jgi:hypothetical protein